METKPLVYAIIGFLLGGFLVSLVAVTIESDGSHAMDDHSSKSMDAMNEELAQLEGRAFDEAFVSMMIDHHEGAVTMAKLADNQAERREIKDLSETIVEAQQSEIEVMRAWQQEWGFDSEASRGHDERTGH